MRFVTVDQVPPGARIDAVQLPIRVLEKAKTRSDPNDMPPLNIPCPGEQGILTQCGCFDVPTLAYAHDFQTGLDWVLVVLEHVRRVNEVKRFSGER
jgi:hypothetical protein